MTETTKTIFEKYEVRKSGRQKREFAEYIKAVAADNGYKAEIENGIFKAKNIVVGDPDSAKVIYTAHYDTCAVMPFPNFITPKNKLIFILYQILIVIPILAAYWFFGFVGGYVSAKNEILGGIILIASGLFMLFVLFMMMFGPANKHTANDNTSGVTVLLDTMLAMPEELREKVAFVFFDFEEIGLVGSMSFASKHKTVKEKTLVINFDCVSDGNNILIAANGKSSEYSSLLRESFKGNDLISCEVASKVIYPSDQASFKYGVGVCALKRSKKRGILYMDRIHTPKDTVYQYENVKLLTDCAINLAKTI